MFLSAVLTIVMLGAAFIPRASAANNITSWGVKLGDQYTWEAKSSMSATVSSKLLQNLTANFGAGFNLQTYLNTLSYDMDLQLTVNSISDLNCMNSTYVNIPTGVGDVINGTILARNHGDSGWQNYGAIMNTYYLNILKAEMALDQGMGMPPANLPNSTQIQQEANMMCPSNLSLINVPVAEWVKASFEMSTLPTGFPTNWLPFFAIYGPGYGNGILPTGSFDPYAEQIGPYFNMLLIMPTDVNLQTVFNYLDTSLQQSTCPPNNVTYPCVTSITDAAKNAGGYVTVTQNEIKIGMDAVQAYRTYLKNMSVLLNEPIMDPTLNLTSSLTGNVGMYMGWDTTTGVLNGQAFYANVSATFKDPSATYGPGYSWLAGESMTFGIAQTNAKPGFTIPSATDLYPGGGIADFSLGILLLVCLPAVGIIYLQIRRRIQ